MNTDIKEILTAVQKGQLSVDDALLQIKTEPFKDIGYAKVDLHRKVRQGAAEVIYGASKTAEQMCGIIGTMVENGQDTILITRLKPEAAEAIRERYELTYYPEARVGIVGTMPEPNGKGKIVIATGGTSDVPVAEEAALTAEALGNEVIRLYDVGVA